MARSPARDDSGSKLHFLSAGKPFGKRFFGDKPLSKEERRQRNKRASGRRPHRFIPLCHHAHVRFSRCKPYTRIVEIFHRAPTPPAPRRDREGEVLRETIAKYKRLCTDLAEDNARLKMEVNEWRTIVQDVYHKDIEVYEAKLAYHNLRRSVAKCITELRKNGSSEPPVDFLNLVPDYERITANESTLTPPKLSLKVRLMSIVKGVAEPPQLETLDEEFQAREGARIVRGVSQMAKSARYKKRHTALPGELLKSLDAANLGNTPSPVAQPKSTPSPKMHLTPTPSTSKNNNIRETPTPTSASSAQRTPTDVYDFQNEIDNSQNLSANKRSLAAAAFDPPKGRRSLVSPRPGRRSTVGLPGPEHANVQPKKLCFQEEENAVEESRANELIVPVPRLIVTSDDGQLETVEEDDTASETGSVDDTLIDEGPRRSNRASSARTKSMKEPSLNKKMRRPVDIPALNPSQEKKRPSRGTRKLAVGGEMVSAVRWSDEASVVRWSPLRLDLIAFR